MGMLLLVGEAEEALLEDDAVDFEDGLDDELVVRLDEDVLLELGEVIDCVFNVVEVVVAEEGIPEEELEDENMLGVEELEEADMLDDVEDDVGEKYVDDELNEPDPLT